MMISPKAKSSNSMLKGILFLSSLSLIIIFIATAGCGKDPSIKIFNEAETRLSRGEYLSAITTHSKLLKKYPKSKLAPQSLFKIGYIYYRYLDNVELAMKTYDELAFLYPKSDQLANAARERGEIYSKLGKHWKAVEEYEWLLTRSETKERDGYQYLIAMEYFKMNDFKQARIEFAEIKDTGDEAGLAPEILFRVATSYYLEKNLTDSLSAYEEVVMRFPGHALAFESGVGIAQIHSDAGRLSEALNVLKELKTKSATLQNELLDIRITLIEKRIKRPTKRRKRK